MKKLLTLALVVSSLAIAQPAYFVRTVAGSAANGDGGPAVDARVISPSRMTGDADGNIYFGESHGTIRKVSANGSISTVAGNNTGATSGDGGPALDAAFPPPWGIAVHGDLLYFVQRYPCQIRRVNMTTGIIDKIAGVNDCAGGPDGAANSTSLALPSALIFDSMGRLLVAESNAVRRIDLTTGQISTIAGGGMLGFGGDGGPAKSAQFNFAYGLAADAHDNLYINDVGNCRIRRVDAATQMIATVAGTGTCSNTGDNGPALQGTVGGVIEMTLDPTGTRLYLCFSGGALRVVDFAANTINLFAGNGKGEQIQTGGPALQTGLRAVGGIWADSAGNVFFTDANANRVGRIDTHGILDTYAGSLTFHGDDLPAQNAPLVSPLEVLVQPDGGFLVSESANARVRRVSPDGVISTFAGNGKFANSTGDGGPALSAVINPGVMTQDSMGNVYIADNTSFTVRRVGTNGVISQVGPPLFSSITGLALDPTEHFLYFSHGQGHRILKVNLADNTNVTFAGKGAGSDTGMAGFSGDFGPATDAQLNSPGRLAVDADGNVYVADTGNARIRKITPSGDRITTIMGNGNTDYGGNGNMGTQASVPGPTGVAVDADGNVYASNVNAIFRLDKASGRVNRIAGGTVRGNSSLGGPAADAKFNILSGISVDQRGVIYAAELFNYRVIALAPSTLPNPVITGIITPGAFGAGNTLSPGGWLEIYGEKFATATREWAGGDFNNNVAPTSLNGVHVHIQGKDAFVQLISPGQINAVAPDGFEPGNVSVEVVNDNGASDKVAMLGAARGPNLLAPPSFSAAGKQYVVAILPDGTYVGPPNLIPGAPFRRAQSGDHIVMYGVGFGGVNPVVPAGNIATVATALPNVQVQAGGVQAQVEYAGLAGGFVGLYQLNVVVPAGVTGDVLLTVTVDGIGVVEKIYLAVE